MRKEKLKSLLIPTDTNIKQAMQKLDKTAEKILFVVDEHNRLLGTITDGDVRRGLLNGLSFNVSVESVMCQNFISIGFDALDLKKQAEKLMIGTKIEQLPVLNEKGVIVDVILWTDLFGINQVKQKMKYPNHIVIMAGGKGERLDPFTKILPKPLIPIGNKPVIELIMERYYQYGFYKFIYTLNYKKEYLKLFLKEYNSPFEIDWIEEDDYLGTAGGLSLLKNKISDTFFITNCDSLLDIDFAEVLNWHKENSASITIVGCHNEIKIPFGVLELSNGKLVKILEKPAHDVIINTGVYIVEPHVISYIDERRQIDMNELIDLVSEKEKITVYPIYDRWLNIGHWEDYKESLKKLGI